MNPLHKVQGYVMAHMEEEPIAERIELCLALAEITTDPVEKAALTNHVAMLREIEAHHVQMLHHFRAAHPPAA